MVRSHVSEDHAPVQLRSADTHQYSGSVAQSSGLPAVTLSGLHVRCSEQFNYELGAPGDWASKKERPKERLKKRLEERPKEWKKTVL